MELTGSGVRVEDGMGVEGSGSGSGRGLCLGALSVVVLVTQVGDYLLGGRWSRQLLPPTFSLLEPGNMYCRYNRYHLLSNMPCLVLVVFLLSSSSPASAPLPPLP